MIDKIKAFLTNIKMGILYIVGPLLAIFGYIMYLREKNNTLEQSIEHGKEDQILKAAETAKEKEDGEAVIAEGDYNTLRDEYLKQSSPSDPTKPQT